METLWRVGQPSGPRTQFNDGWFFDPANGPAELRVGVDDPSRCWPGWHPGPLHAWTGWEPKSATLVFELAAPHGLYELVFELYAGQGPCPQLQVAVNGTAGLFFLDLRREGREGIVGTSTIAAWATLRVPIPAALLRSGTNRVVVTTVAVAAPDPGERGRAHPEFPYFWGSAVQHAGIELRHLGDAPLPPPSVTATALPLYVRDAAGGLQELVDVVVTAPAGFSQGHVSLRVGAQTVAARLDGVAFGQARARLAIAEPAAGAQARAVVTLDREQLEHTAPLQPARKWTLHLLPHVHLDLGYTDYQAKVFEGHARSIDRALDIIERQPDYAYSVDGSIVVDQYLASRSPAAVARMRAAFDSGALRSNAFSLLFLTGLASLEECYRAGYRAARLRRDLGLDFDYANLTDVPSYSKAIPSVVAAMGLDAFVGIQNHGRAATADSDDLHLQSPFVWEGPDGARILTFFADAYAQLRYWCGHPPTIVGCADAFTRVLRRYERADYAPADLPIVGINADNEDLAGGEADLVERWNAAYAYPHLRFSTVSDYLDAVRPLADRLPVVRGDGGSYWEDGVGAGAAITAAYRHAQSAVAAAEAAAALVAATDPLLAPARPELDRAWDALLVGCEHTWTSMHAPRRPGSDQTVDQLAWKRHQVATAVRLGRDELRRALSQLGERVTTGGPSLLVFNPLGFPRRAVVEVELPAATDVCDAGSAHVVGTVDDLQRVRVDAGVIPAFGYRALPLEAAGSARPGPARLRDVTDVIEAGAWRLTLAGDRVGSLVHARSGAEVLDGGAPWSLGEVLYVTATRPEPTTLHDNDARLPAPELDIHRAAAKPQGWRRIGDSAEVVFAGEAPSLPRLETVVRLDGDAVEVVVRMVKEHVSDKESVYVAFPFATGPPTVTYDRQQGWVDPATDHLPGACNEWFTVHNAVVVQGNGLCVAWTSLAAPLFTVGDVVRGRWPRRFTAPSGTLLSWVMNNHWWTNFPASQGGDVELRYRFTVIPSFDPTAAARFGREARNPPVAAQVGWMDKMDTAARRLPPDGALLDVDAPDGLVVTAAAARAADGILARVQDVGGQGGTARLAHPRLRAAWLTTAVEDDLAELPVDGRRGVTVEVTPWSVVTLRLELD